MATLTKGEKHFSQERYDRYVVQQVRAMEKARAKGHRDFKHWTDDDIREVADDLARINNAGEYYA